MTERDIFLGAIDIPQGSERAAYLASACGGDAGLRARVEALLRSHEEAGSFLDLPPAGEGANLGPIRTLPGSGAAPGDGPTRTQGELPDDEYDDALGFLAPARRADSLGRVGHYEVLEVLGRGGFGVVFRAFDDVLQRVVAVKVLAPSLAATSPARKRFLREARSAAPIRHENVVRIFETGEEPLPYLVMEFVPGETLQQRLDRTGPLDVPDALRIAHQVAEGLAAAHDRGLIHRDIKPSNILIDSGPQQAKITDFGLARAADDASLTRSGVVAGTPMYMAPEQAKGEALDHRADLFSLGSVLYAMLTGRLPFRAENTPAVLKRVADDTPRPIREVIPEVPEWLCRIVERLQAKNPVERFQKAREVADVLADCERQLQAHGALKDYSRIPGGNPAKPQWRLPRPIVAAAALLLLVTTVLLNQFNLSSEHTRHRSALMGVLISVVAVGVSQYLSRPDEAGTPTRRRSRVPVWAVLVCTAVSTLTAAAVWPPSDLEDMGLFLIAPLVLAALVSLILAWVTESRHPTAGSETPTPARRRWVAALRVLVPLAAPRGRFRHWKRAAAVIVLVLALAGGTYAAPFALRYANGEGKVSLTDLSPEENVLVRRDGEVVATLGPANPSVYLAPGEYELEAVCAEGYEVGIYLFRISRLFEGSPVQWGPAGPVLKLTVRRGDTTRVYFSVRERAVPPLSRGDRP